MCDLVIQASSEEPDIGLLVVNILIKDLNDPNPSVRSTAITTICSLAGLVAHVEAAVGLGLQDSSAGVRVSAVTGVGRVWRHSPALCHELGLVSALYSMLRDPEPTVVSFTLQTLNVILEKEGGVRINKKMARYLLSRVVHYREKEFCYVVDFLHTPDWDEDLTLETLNSLDSFLDHSDGNVMLGVAKLFIKLVQNISSLRSSLIKRIVPVFASYLNSSSQREFNHHLLEYIRIMDQDYIDALKPQVKVFFPKSRDTEKLKITKIKFLPNLILEDTAMESINFILNLLPQSRSLNMAVFETLARICTSETSCYSHCLMNLELLLKTDCDTYLEDILDCVVMFKLDEYSETETDKVIPFVMTIIKNLKIPNIKTDSIPSVFYLLEHFAKYIQQPENLIDDIMRLDKSSWSTEHYSLLLSSSYEVFLLRPAAMQTLKGIYYKLNKG